ncbi:arylalkylamine N-acetyltransferase 1-like [Diorhabda carinulata]|uniref:arylalkylamine N-acetyltransferase 1-like n=1 Tax=Diorhabda carinulata TaxID=1163345 RepID=UPI0025A1A29F|nr:arylalkylamine N-acetyltransferase 1-like [Diorhabda carinulata]XP_057655512.1 arylalkylamine N-acetyltransferase 1-like [Diorhabda carinulata]XP_057655513.1 arylalkylamine N-acetyltransferase 1-like [Diorhabda carinulata]
MEYTSIPASRFEEVIRHLRLSFPDEPLNASVGLSLYGKPCSLLEQYDLSTLEEGLSVMAVDTYTNEIAGVLLNGTSKKGDIEEAIKRMETIDNIPYQQIFGLLNNVNKELDLFTKYRVDKIFEFRILAVDPKYRGQGVGKELFLRSEMIAAENGFKLMKVDATSFFTQKICDSFGFETIKTIRYGDYLDENGQKIYNTKSPHDYYKVMIKILHGKRND